MLGDFRVDRLLGSGGMGDVYLARDTQLGRRVAIKVLRTNLKRDGDQAERRTERFLFESRTTARFSHPNIVTVYAAGTYESMPYLALEYLDGEDLRQRVEGVTLGTREAARYALALAEALAEAHAHKVVHGDLKPENVIIPRDGRPRVVDFGLAQVLLQTMEFSLEDTPILSSDQVTTTTTLSVLRHNKGVVAGTPPYMAPEQWRGEDLTGAADIWALGIILFELLCGRRPFTGANVVMQAAAITGPDPAPALDVPGAPRALVSLVARCLNKDPAERPSAQEAAEILRMSVDDRRGPREVEENPFRGLRPFAEQHAAFFCGRDDEVDAFLELMREEPVLPVVGPSGAGKTSFVQAGVIPRLREQGHLTVLQLRPGDAPFRNLASRLAPALAAGISFADQLGSQDTQSLEHLTSSTLDREENLEQQLRSQPQLLPLLLEQVAGQRGGKVLLFVDQLEELFTLTEEHDEHRKFVRALSAGADDPAGPVRVIYTMREDFLGRLEAEQARVAPLGRITVIHPPNADVLREVLEHPLRTVGYAFEDLGLLGEMVQAAGRDSASLPLLSFTAGQLWEQRDRKRRLITRAAYEEVGGVAGALAAHADRVLERLDPTGEAAVRSILLQMVTPEGTRRAVSRQDALEGLAQNVEPILDRLIDARLVTVRRVRGEAGSRVVLELVHESLIYTWGTLDRWLDRGKEDLAFLQEAGQAVEVWDRRGRRADEVWQGEALAEALRSMQRCAEQVPEPVRQFIEAGQQRQASARRRVKLVLAAVAVLLLVVTASQIYQKRQADRQRDLARKN